MAYEVPDLPYDYNALEPHIDEETMRIHHDKHHQAYVDNLNAALTGTEWADTPIEEVVVVMEKHQIRRVPVVDENGSCTGIIATADVAWIEPEREVGELVREVSRDMSRPSR